MLKVYLSPVQPARGRLGVIFLTVLIDLIGFGIILPILPYLALRFGAGGLGLGVLMGAYSGMQFISTLALGRLSDRIGRRPVLLATIVLNAAGYLLFALADSYGALLLARLVSGGASGNIAVAQAYIADITPPAERSRRLGLIGAAFGIGSVTGPFIGGIAAHYIGQAGPGLFAAMLSLINLVLAIRILPESLGLEHRAKRRLFDIAHARAAFANPRIRSLLLLWLLAAYSWTGFITVLPLFAGHQWGWQATHLGWFFAGVGVVTITVQGWGFGKLSRWIRDRTLLIVGLIGMAAAIAVIPFEVSMPAFWASTFILALSNSLFGPALVGFTSSLAEPSEQGTMLGLAQALAALGRLAGPETFGGAYDVAGGTVAFVGSAVVMAVAALVAARMPAIGNRPPASVGPAEPLQRGGV